MKSIRLSEQVFSELPPSLAHYIDQERNVWLESIPREGKTRFRDIRSLVLDIDTLAIGQRLMAENVGVEWARAIQYQQGYELGKLDAVRHDAEFQGNVRMALQAAPVYRQVLGWYSAENVRFEFDLGARTLYRELLIRDSIEAEAYRLWGTDDRQCACCATAGYLAGHAAGILDAPVLTVETECVAKGDARCRFISRLDPEWGEEADWIRSALTMPTVRDILARHEEQLAAAQRAEQRARSQFNDLNRRFRSDRMLDTLVGESDAMQAVLRRVRQVTDCDAPVLLVGESGTGHETLARSIHFGGGRRAKPFVALDCLGLSGPLLTQELIGYERDGIPGANRPHAGAYARAHGGTLYIGEVANLNLETQMLLLRAMREGVVYTLGGERPVKADVRVVAATRHDLARKTKSGEFLEHLYYALSVAAIPLPPLRERGTDILRLADVFLQEACEHYGRSPLQFARDVHEALLDCAWPGNLRQLRAAVEHAVIVAQDETIELSDLPDEILAVRWTRPQQELTEPVIRAALARTHGNRIKAAELLGVSRTSLWRAMKRLKVEG